VDSGEKKQSLLEEIDVSVDGVGVGDKWMWQRKCEEPCGAEESTGRANTEQHQGKGDQMGCRTGKGRTS